MDTIMINENNKAIILKAKKRVKIKKICFNTLKYLFLMIFSLFFLFQFIVMICYSILPDGDALRGVLISPSHVLNIGTYIKLFKTQAYLRYVGNSLTVSLLAALGAAFSASLCAYGFAKLKFTGKNVVFSIMLASMMLPSIATQIPLYIVYSKINWTNSLFPLWVPAWFGGGATTVFLMTQFMKGIPNDVANAAKIDGANSFRIYISIMVPLCIPIFLFVAVNAFMGAWNDFTTPLFFINEKKWYTLAFGIYKDYGGAITVYNLPNITMAAGVIMMLPCMILFFIFQRYLIEGVSVTGVKG